MSSFAEALRRARRMVGLTQEQLGFEVHVSKSAVSAWENGREYPSFHTLLRLLRLRAVLRISLDALLDGEVDRAQGSLSEPEQVLLQRFRDMSVRRQNAFLEILNPES